MKLRKGDESLRSWRGTIIRIKCREYSIYVSFSNWYFYQNLTICRFYENTYCVCLQQTMLPKMRCRRTVALNFRSLFQTVRCEKKKKQVLRVPRAWKPPQRFWTPVMTWLWLSLVRMRIPIPEENVSLLRSNGRNTGNCRHFVKGIQLQIFLISERLHKHWLSHREPDVTFSHHVMASTP